MQAEQIVMSSRFIGDVSSVTDILLLCQVCMLHDIVIAIKAAF